MVRPTLMQMLLEDLQKLVEQNLSSICSNLQILKSQKKLLSENADKVKATIKDATDSQVNLLKMKERQLLRQVEFVTAHQNSLIDAQIANILISKGSLMTSQDILSRCDPEDLETLVKISDCTHISVKPVSTLKMVSVQLDTNQLSNAIENFGQAHLPDSIMHHHSSVVPAKPEDYGDSDQVVLHKSINMTSDNITADGDSPFTINVKLPKLPKSSWLAPSQKKIPNVLPPFSPNKGLTSWLSDLHVSEEKEDNKMWLQNKMEDDEMGSFQFLDDSNIIFSPEKSHKSVYAKSCGSSSIEIVNSVESKELYRYSKFNDNSHLWKEQPVAKNLPSATKPLPDIEFICQANELCKSCNDCVCPSFCESLAKEKALQTSKWLEKSHFQKDIDSQTVFPRSSFTPLLEEAMDEDQVVKHMIDIQNSDNKDWLVKPNEEKVSGFQLTKFTPDQIFFLSSSSEKTWIQKADDPESKEKEAPVKSATKTWLLGDLSDEIKNEINHLNVVKSLDKEDKGKEEKDNKNIENKLNFIDLKESLKDLDVEQNVLKDNKYCFYSPNANIRKIQQTETDYERKFRWLFNSSSTTSNMAQECTYKVSPKLCFIDLPTRKVNKWLLKSI